MCESSGALLKDFVEVGYAIFSPHLVEQGDQPIGPKKPILQMVQNQRFQAVHSDRSAFAGRLALPGAGRTRIFLVPQPPSARRAQSAGCQRVLRLTQGRQESYREEKA